MRVRLPWWLLLLSAATTPAAAHDIPNARVDRSIQVTVRLGRLEVDYEVSLSELTLTQDLKALTGGLRGGDRDAWFDRYGREVGPLNAKGLLVAVDGLEFPLRVEGFSLDVEDHPRYTFRLAAEVPDRGTLALKDINYVSSEGMSRLAIRGREGVEVRADNLPPDVEAIPWQPVYLLSDDEERRTKQVECDYGPTAGEAEPTPPTESRPAVEAPRQPLPGSADLGRLFDRAGRLSVVWLGLLAIGLGAVHAIQPGHGKAVVAASVLGERGAWWRGLVLAVVTTATHFASVLAIAGLLWLTRSGEYGAIDRALTRGAGFLIAGVGLWRLGRILGGFPTHGHAEGMSTDRGLIGIGVAGGIVPCWDAVTLVVLAEALGRLGLGLFLVAGFSLGMASVLVAVGLVAGRARSALERRSTGFRWERPLGLAASLALTGIGLYLFGS